VHTLSTRPFNNDMRSAGYIYAQVLLVKKALKIRFDITKLLDDTISEIKSLHHCIADMGKINTDKHLTVFLMNALVDQLPHLQSAIQSMSSNTRFCLAHVTLTSMRRTSSLDIGRLKVSSLDSLVSLLLLRLAKPGLNMFAPTARPQVTSSTPVSSLVGRWLHSEPLL
jgi:hypothetical protein